jgi:hypothetical protein
MRQQCRTRPRLLSALVILLTFGVLIFTAGCTSHTGTRATGSISQKTPAAYPSTTVRVSQPLTTRWPTGLAATVLSHAAGFTVVGPEGVIFEETRSFLENKTTETIVGPAPCKPTYELVTSGDQKVIAYAFAGEGLVVRPLADGTVVGKAPFTLSATAALRALSDDGRFLALAPWSGSVTGEPYDGTPWTLSVLDITQGKEQVASSLAALVKERLSGNRNPECALASVHWLPDNRLLIGLSGAKWETYTYDPASDALKLIPDLGYVYAVSANGMVLGRGTNADSSVVWHNGTAEPVVPDKAWPHAGSGAISADGATLVLAVAKTADWKTPHGWQVFHRLNSEWRPAGPAAEVNWMSQQPWQVSADGSRAWTVVGQSTSTNHTVLLSHDFVSGKWAEWFRPEDMQVDLGNFYFASLIPNE